jgi:type I restriction enzyme S subunit
MKDKATTKPFYNSTIPNDWKVVEFGEFAEIIMGQSPGGNTYNQNGNGVALINGPTEFTEKYPVKVQWTTSPTKICREGDILLCVRGSSTGRLNIANEEYCIGRGVAAIRARKNSNHSFLEFQIENIVNKILALTTGSTFPNIDSQSLKRIKVSLPSLPEQKAIAHILSLMDTAINKNNLLIAKKELQKKWLMQNLLTGKKRLKGFDGEWKEILFENFAEVVMGQSPEGSTYNNTGNGVALINGPTEFTEKYPVKVQWTSSPTKICKEGDILLCVRGSSTGRLNIANEEYCIGRGIAAIRAKKNSDHSFLEFLVDNVVNKILSLTAGSTFPNIDSKSIKSIEVSLPPFSEQTAIAQVLQAADKEIQILKTKTEKFREQKKGLMQVLLTGKKRLKI